MVKQKAITLPPMPKGYHLITHKVVEAIGELPESGLMHVLIQHTSAGLTLNENADPSVRYDFESFMNHIFEGSDDMPAHLKASIMGSSVTIPITNGRLNLGTWQGIYFCEFRNHGGSRRMVITVTS